MIRRGPWLALVLAVYLLVAGTFAFFAIRIKAIHHFLDRIIANQERLIDHVTRHEQCMVRESADLAEILRRLPIPERK
jgi:hypothetical protein